MKRLALAVAVGAALTVLPGSAGADGAWLDQQPLAQWNQADMAVPSATAATPGDLINPRCIESRRPAETLEDSEVEAAGWLLVGEYQAGWGVKIVTGTTGYDGMCRPLGYQQFVFVDGAFAGTISPLPMNSRTDGAASHVFLSARDLITVDFARYSASDPLCCPSRSTLASYRIDRTDQGPVLMLVSAFTQPDSQ
jgi:hypothetical protein